MTLDKFYLLTSLLVDSIDRNKTIGPINDLANNLDNLKIYRTNATNPSIAQSINNVRAQLPALKERVSIGLLEVKTELGNNNFYDEKTFFENFLSDSDFNNINALSQNIDINKGIDLASGSLKKIQKLYNFYTNLKEFDKEFTISDEKISRDQLLIIFENEVFIDNLKELSKASEDWSFIVHSFGRLVEDNDTKAEVLSIQRGSLIITVAIAAGIITAITKSSNQIMDSVLKALSIKQKLLELRKLFIDTESAELDLLEKKASIKTNTLAAKITTDLMEEYQKGTDKVDYKEIESFVRKSVKRMIVFNSKGGKLKPLLIDPTPEQLIEILHIKKLNEEVDELQKSIGQVEQGKHTLLLEDNLDEENDIQ